MPTEPETLRLIHDQEQDETNALAWWRQESNEDKMKVWDAIQATGSDDVQEIVLRFAQIGMTRIALLALEQPETPN